MALLKRRLTSGRGRKSSASRDSTPAETDPGIPGWTDGFGVRMFAVDLTPGGFPIGVPDDDDLESWLPDDDEDS